MKVTLVNYGYDRALSDPDALLDAYETLTGWAEAVASAGARVSVVQAFHRDADVTRRGIAYAFRSDGGARLPRSGTSWRWTKAFEETVRRADPDVVHVNSLEFVVQTWRLRRELPRQTALVVQDHGGGPPRARSLASPLRRRLMRAADAFLFTAVEQAEPWQRGGFIGDVQRVYDVLESSTTIRPMGRRSARAISGVQGAPAVLWVGRLLAFKDPLTVLDGFDRALVALPGAVLTMVFDVDELLPEVRARIGGMSRLKDRVRLVGPVPHVQMSAFFSAADLYVSGSAREGSGYAAIEACACGVAPVVTDIAPFRAVTGGGSIGALWRLGDASDLARALVGLVRADLDALRVGVTDHFERHLSWSAVGARAVAVYEDVQSHRLARAPAR